MQDLNRPPRPKARPGAMLIPASRARRLEVAGADGILICTNTVHKTAPRVQSSVSIPVLHIADAASEAILAEGGGPAGLLGTRYTMEEEFYRGRMAEKHGLEVLVPDEVARAEVNRIIFEELCVGEVLNSSREFLEEVVDGLRLRGARGIILGCTELPMILKNESAEIPFYDTTKIHAERAVQFALG